MKLNFTFNFLLVLLILLLQKAEATHIVGGEINYKCLGNNNYEITLRVFRDCDTGVPWFDNPASIGVFDSNNQLVYDLRLLMRENDTLDLGLNDPCLVAPPNVCIHTTSYVDTVNLPFRTGGYQLVYQRCCRNVDIVNIVNPLDAGATYYALITEEALSTCNSSAIFNEWPPVYICVNRPISFDHSATDADGDSLVYEMCTPLDGATPFNPMPQPPNNPPFIPVNWLPGFSESNMLGGLDSLRINSQTGLLQGTPTIMGVFVVGICVKEYRNGVLISETRRDFQYAIGICGQLVNSAFFAPAIQCDNSLLVQFQNNSSSLGTGYQWFFGDNNASSSLENPIYIYPDTGTYTITLIADPGSQCADTTSRTINLQYESIIMDFDVSVLECSDTTLLQIVDLTVDTISNIISWNWDFGNGLSDTVPFSSTYYTQSGTYPIRLTVEAANGCSETLLDSIVLNVPNISSVDTVAICPGQTDIVLNPGGDTTHTYLWSPSTGLNNPNLASPIANPLVSTTYNVTVTANNGIDSCFLYKSVTVLVAPQISLRPIADTISCNDTIVISANGVGLSNFEWSFDPGFNPIISDQNPVSFSMPFSPFSADVYLRASDNYGCSILDTFKIERTNIPIIPDFTFNYMSCTDELTVQFTDNTTDSSQGSIQLWYWDFGNGNFSSDQNPIAIFENDGPYTVSLNVMTSLGCFGIFIDTLDPIILPLLNQRDSVGICLGQTSVELNPSGNSGFSYQWAPSTGLNATNIPNPIASPTIPTFYTVTVTSNNPEITCINVDTVFVGFPPPVTVSVPNVQYCGNEVTLLANSSTAISYEWSDNAIFSNIIQNNNPAIFNPLTFPFAGYHVRVTDAYGCTATDFALVEQINLPVNVSFSDTVINCSDSISIQFFNTTILAPNSNIENISWTVLGPENFNSNLNNPIFNFTQSGIYTIELYIELNNGCNGTSSQTIDLNLPVISGDSIVGICAGESSLILNQNGDSSGVSYIWSPATGLSDPFAASPIASPTTTPFTYTVSITSNNYFGSCLNVIDVTVVEAPPFDMTLTPDTTFCDNRFIAYAMPTQGIVRWEWSTDPDFNFFFLVNANPVQLNFGTTPFTYTLYLRAFDQFGCNVIDTGVYRFVTDTIPVLASAVPTGCNSDSLNVQFSDLTTYSGGTIQQYLWNFGNGNVSDQSNPVFNYGASDSTHQYSLFIRMNNGCTGVYYDSILYQLPAFATNDSLGLCGDFNPVILNQGGNPNLIYQWSPSTGLSSTTVPSPILTPSSNITYNVTITSPNDGDTCTAIQEFTVNTDLFEFSAMGDTLLCDNQISLYVNSPTATNVTWALDSAFTQVLGFGNPFVTNINTTSVFYAMGENGFGCTAVDSVLVRVRNDEIDVNFEIDNIGCIDSFSVQFTDLTIDTVNNSIQSWFWDFGDANQSQLQNPIHSYQQSGIYNVTLSVVTENGCNGQTSQIIEINIPNINLGLDTIISCGGESVFLNPSADTSLTYQWSPSTGLDNPNSANPLLLPTVSGTYTVTITSYQILGSIIDSCVYSKSVFVNLTPPLNIEAGADSTYCSNDIILDVQTNNTVDVQWSLDSEFDNIISNQNSIIYNQSIENQVYFVRVTDVYGCVALDSVNISQYAFETELDSAAIACPNEPAELNLTVSGADYYIYSYAWAPDSLVLSGQGSAQIITSPEQNSQFTVIVSNQFGCSDTLNSIVNVSGSYPIFDIYANPDSIFLGENSQLTATEMTNYTYIWDFNESLSYLDIYNPIASPTETQMYFLTVRDSFGCSSRDSILVFVKNFICEEPFVFIPNTFTPDGDGINDVLYVRANVISEMYLAIYNRWGEIVFESNDQNVGWDGTYKGEKLSPDVYGYYLRYKCTGQTLDDEPKFKKGNITLIR